MTSPRYQDAGVNRSAAEEAIDRIIPILKRTHGPNVLGGIGGFGALYQLSGFNDPVLVSSTDGVGTKLKLAIELSKYNTIGEDLVNACLNDVIVSGAKPLFFLDYIAVGSLDPSVIEKIITGMSLACEKSECSIIGGEMAEMPGLYTKGDFDLAGFAVGAVERKKILSPSKVVSGDLMIGLPSNGLHTNGYSLIRAALGLDDDPGPLRKYHPELEATLGEALLEPHTAYWPAVKMVLDRVKSMAHITGGGLIDNVPRALPVNLSAAFDSTTWDLPPIFPLIQDQCGIDTGEMYRVFNMGIGMLLVCASDQADSIISEIPSATIVGEVIETGGGARVML